MLVGFYGLSVHIFFPQHHHIAKRITTPIPNAHFEEFSNIKHLKNMEIISNPVQVIQGTPEQKAMFKAFLEQKGKLTSNHFQLSDLQEQSIPSVIDNLHLNKQDKANLLLNSFTPNAEVSYFVDEKGFINRHFLSKETDKEKRFIKFDDVKFDMKKTIPNQENFEYLKRTLKYLGFGENLSSALEARLKEGKDKFTLGASAVFDTVATKDIVNYELRFSKSSTTDNYFLNNYQAVLEKGSTTGKGYEPISQVFELNKGNDITAKEAYNLLSGRSIQKKADIPNKLSVFSGTDEIARVFKISEAKAKIHEQVKLDSQTTYTVKAKDHSVLRNFDKTGNELPITTSDNNVQVIHYLSRKTEDGSRVPTNGAAYDIDDLKAVPAIVKDLIKDKNTENVTIVDNDVPVMKFDAAGTELDLEPTTRKEEIWVKFDFEKRNEQGNFPLKTYFQTYGFDLEKSLSLQSIKELNDPEKKDRLLSSLRRGNLQSVTIERNGAEEKVFVSANPQYKNLSLFDKDLKPIFEKPAEKKAADQANETFQKSR